MKYSFRSLEDIWKCLESKKVKIHENYPPRENKEIFLAKGGGQLFEQFGYVDYVFLLFSNIKHYFCQEFKNIKQLSSEIEQEEIENQMKAYIKQHPTEGNCDQWWCVKTRLHNVQNGIKGID